MLPLGIMALSHLLRHALLLAARMLPYLSRSTLARQNAPLISQHSTIDSDIDAGKYPGDDSPVVWGVCGHAFHLQCINKWLSSQTEQRCPFCRRSWEYKSAGPVQMDAEEAS